MRLLQFQNDTFQTVNGKCCIWLPSEQQYSWTQRYKVTCNSTDSLLASATLVTRPCIAIHSMCFPWTASSMLWLLYRFTLTACLLNLTNCMVSLRCTTVRHTDFCIGSGPIYQLVKIVLHNMSNIAKLTCTHSLPASAPLQRSKHSLCPNLMQNCAR